MYFSVKERQNNIYFIIPQNQDVFYQLPMICRMILAVCIDVAKKSLSVKEAFTKSGLFVDFSTVPKGRQWQSASFSSICTRHFAGAPLLVDAVEVLRQGTGRPSKCGLLLLFAAQCPPPAAAGYWCARSQPQRRVPAARCRSGKCPSGLCHGGYPAAAYPAPQCLRPLSG